MKTTALIFIFIFKSVLCNISELKAWYFLDKTQCLPEELEVPSHLVSLMVAKQREQFRKSHGININLGTASEQRLEIQGRLTRFC